MTLRYLNYTGLNIEEELKKIKQCERAEIHLEPKKKDCLFILGMLFVNGVPITILNESDLNLEETNKSFSIMPYVWSKIADKSFPSKDYSNVRTEMDTRVENIKRLGVELHSISNQPEEKKIFLICPVRNATPEQKKWIENFVEEKTKAGYSIHAPHLHTRQTDLFGGFAICKQNAEAVASSEEIDVYYDQSSTGSVFDLGVAYALEKPLVVLNKNEIEFRKEDSIDQIVNNWKYGKKKYKLMTAEGKIIMSSIPGKIGGNKRLKIYGRLDCPSANRWIQKGYYVKDRVFFKDEKTAIEAGYRPCAVCMKEEYKVWKKQKKAIK